METAKVVLEYLKALSSPQLIAAAVALVFFFVFKQDIRDLMRRIAKIRFPGGSEVSTSQVERASEELSPNTEPPAAGEVTLPQNLSLSPEQVEAVGQLFQAERATAFLWEYRYLNYFLAPNTQRVLDWLASLTTRTTLGFFDSFWLPILPSVQERRAIIEALEAHHLIVPEGELIQVTPKAREYLQWRGPLPEPHA